MSRQNISFSGEFDIGSPELSPLVCYPRFSDGDYAARTAEMSSLGVHSIVLEGGTVVNGLPICGKGCVGLVLCAKGKGGLLLALKIRRTDADRPSMDGEAQFHQIANAAGVGPRYFGHTQNMMAMEFVEGQSIIEWIRTAASPEQFRAVARSVLNQCFMLDQAGIDHGELSRLGRHVIVSKDGRPYIIDFESASTVRRPSNVTSAAQSLFLFGSVAGRAREIAGPVDSEKAISLLSRYKRQRSSETYSDLTDFLKI